MEQTRGGAQQPPNPFECPRCNSPDTKFRYLNNNKPTQPRYYCRSCRRQWTVGGTLRNIPIGGNSKSGKQTQASSSRYGNPICQPSLPFGEHLQGSQSVTPMEVMAPQNFNTAMIQTSTNQPEAEFPEGSNYFNDGIPCLDVIQSLIHPELINQHLDGGNQIGNAGTSMTIPQEQNSQPMASRQDFHEQVTGYIESYQTYNQANSMPPYLHNNSLVQDIPTYFGAPTSNVSSWNNSWGGTADTEMDTSSVNIDEWLNFPDNDSL